MEHALKVRGVSKSFGTKTILQDITLNVEKGEVLGLIGSSGSGKTTLLRCMIGFYAPEKGEVIFGKDVSVLKNPEITKRAFGFASQEPSFYEKLTAKENLLYFASIYGIKDAHKRADKLLALVGLRGAENTVSGKLSGGMERRLDIACALIHEPAILFLDEPTSDLDPALRLQIWKVVRDVNRTGTTIVLASHHLAEIDGFCSRIAVLKQGKIVDVDTPLRFKLKHTESEQIVLQSYPGNYLKIAQALRSKKISVRGSEIAIYTSNPSAVLPELISTMKDLGEEIIDIRVSRPSLDELFSKMTRKD